MRANVLDQAYFNVMLKEMGARGLRIHELWSLDDDMLAVLPYVYAYHSPRKTQLTQLQSTYTCTDLSVPVPRRT